MLVYIWNLNSSSNIMEALVYPNKSLAQQIKNLKMNGHSWPPLHINLVCRYVCLSVLRRLQLSTIVSLIYAVLASESCARAIVIFDWVVRFGWLHKVSAQRHIECGLLGYRSQKSWHQICFSNEFNLHFSSSTLLPLSGGFIYVILRFTVYTVTAGTVYFNL